jgi:hypothetical protein
VHVAVEDRTRATMFWLRSLDDRHAVFGSDAYERALSFAAPPGRYEAACVRGGRPIGGVAVVEIVDPDSLWVGSEPSCPDPIDRQIDIGPVRPAGTASLIEAIRTGLPGVLPGDVIREPGYPDAAWPSFRVPFVSVVRNGQVVATVVSYALRERIKVCPGTGIAEPKTS